MPPTLAPGKSASTARLTLFILSIGRQRQTGLRLDRAWYHKYVSTNRGGAYRTPDAEIGVWFR